MAKKTQFLQNEISVKQMDRKAIIYIIFLLSYCFFRKKIILNDRLSNMADIFEKRIKLQETAGISSASLKDINWRVKVSRISLNKTLNNA